MAFKMMGKSPMMKKLIGKQANLPAELKAKIQAAPESPAKMAKDPAMKMKKAPTKMKKEEPMKMKKAAMKMKKAPLRNDEKTREASYRLGEQGLVPDAIQNLFRGKDNKIKRPSINTETGEPVKPKTTPKPRPKVKTLNKIEPKKVGKISTTKKSEVPKKVAVQTKAEKERAKVEKRNKTMKGKTQLKDTKLGKVKIGKGKDAKNLSDTKIGKAFSKGRAKGVAARQARAERMAAAKAERIAKRKARKDARNSKK